MNNTNKSDASKPKNSMQRIVISTLLVILGMAGIFSVSGLAKGSTRTMVLILGGIILVALLFAIRGNLIAGQIIAPFSAASALIFAAYNGKGFHDEILIGLPVAIVLAGLLLGNRGTLVVSIFSIIGITTLGLLEINGDLSATLSSYTSYEDVATASLMIVAIALVQGILINRLNVSLEESRRYVKAQELTNRELRSLQADLEKRVSERTVQLNARAAQLQATSEVGRAVASISDPDELLSNVTKLISERFGYYHVGIFLIDRVGENAILRASNSPGGKRMLENGHSLQVGSRSIVGYVTQYREPRIALDVGMDATYFNNPDLPQTRSEMALPLIAAGRLLGVLDVQSSEVAAFSQDDIGILQVLTDQVAIAIENSTLFAESQAALESARRAYGEMTQDAWTRLFRTKGGFGYRSDRNGSISRVEGSWSKDIIRAHGDGQPIKADDCTLVIPFKILDLPAGAVRLKKQENSRGWSDREVDLMETLVGNLGEALESARLYEDTQHRAERERIASDISTRIRESLDVDTVLQTAVLEMRRALNLDEITIRLGESNGQ